MGGIFSIVVLALVGVITEESLRDDDSDDKRDLHANRVLYGTGTLFTAVGSSAMSLPEHHANGHVLMRLHGGRGQELQGQTFAVAAWDAATGKAQLMVQGESDPRGPAVLTVTGAFFDGDHKPNGTISAAMSDGETVGGHWLVHPHEEGLEEMLKNNPRHIKYLMDALPEYFA